MRVDERLLKYVSYWTTSSEDSDTIPSTDRQFNLAKELEKELLDLGLQKVTLTDHCYIYGLIPATPGYEDKKRSALFPIWIRHLIFPVKMSNPRSFRITTVRMLF